MFHEIKSTSKHNAILHTNATFQRFEQARFENATRAASKSAAIPFENTNEKQERSLRHATSHARCARLRYVEPSARPRAPFARTAVPPALPPAPRLPLPRARRLQGRYGRDQVASQSCFCHRPGADPPRAPCLLLSSDPGRRVQGCVAQRGGLGGPACGPLSVRDPPLLPLLPVLHVPRAARTTVGSEAQHRAPRGHVQPGSGMVLAQGWPACAPTATPWRGASRGRVSGGAGAWCACASSVFVLRVGLACRRACPSDHSAELSARSACAGSRAAPCCCAEKGPPGCGECPCRCTSPRTRHANARHRASTRTLWQVRNGSCWRCVCGASQPVVEG